MNGRLIPWALGGLVVYSPAHGVLVPIHCWRDQVGGVPEGSRGRGCGWVSWEALNGPKRLLPKRARLSIERRQRELRMARRAIRRERP